MREGRREDVPIVLQIPMELIFEIISPNRLAARAISQWVTSLDHLPHATTHANHRTSGSAIHTLIHTEEATHKLRNNPMKYGPIEVPTAGMADEILHSLRRLIGEQPEVDIPKSGVHHRRFCQARRERFRGCGGGDCLFFPCGLFVEDVSFAGFVPSCMGLAHPLHPQGRGW